MRNFPSLIIFFIFLAASPGNRVSWATGAEPFAVVELFTSEGCSSCPPADALLRTLTAEARNSQARIFPLSFHVDYWNDSGWVDPFSSSAFSERQRLYAKINKARNIYTPQIIVNGTQAFAGYNFDLARQSLNQALIQPATIEIELEIISNLSAANSLAINYHVTGAMHNHSLNIAVVERGLSDDVLKGENAGLRLSHDNVVRSFTTIKLKKFHGTMTVVIPQNVKVKNASLIGFVQNPSDMVILGAASLDL